MYNVMLVLKDWNGKSYFPVRQTETKKDAEREIETLKGLNPDYKFVVMDED